MRYRTRLYVDLGILAENYRHLKELCPKNEVLYMVKSGGYGHGMAPIVRFSTTELGIKEFGCATLGEAKMLREELPDLRFDVYVFSDIQFDLQSCSDLYLHRRITPVIANMTDLDFVLKGQEFRHFPLCLKFNTGMNRLGFKKEDTPQIVEKLKHYDRLSITHLISHFSCSSASVETHPMNKKQYDEFKEIKKGFIDSGIELRKTSMANSGAIEQGFALDETHIRPGLIMYGPRSVDKELREKSRWKGRTISRMETYILSVFPVKKGDVAGYGARSVTEDGYLALIAMGYGDGFTNRFCGVKIPFGDTYGEIFGRVNMDMTYLFFKGEKPYGLNPGEKVTIWGHGDEILDFADQASTIPYELFCHLTSRVPRIYGIE